MTSGRLVLARACWNLSAAELRPLLEDPAAIQDLRARRRLPRYVALVDFDNELFVDLDNVLSVESFVHQVRNRAGAALVEVFPDPTELCVSGPEGRFFSEIVVPFVKTAPESAPAERTASRTTVRRTFAPGSEWLYAKIYTGPTVADRVLANVIAPVVAEAEIDTWFFIRYSDPEPHLRVRMHGDPRRLAGDVLPLLAERCAPLVEDGQIARWQLDTYVREVERYGGDEAIVLAERLFGADSACVLDILPAVPGDEGLAWRWRLALCGVDLLLEALGIEDRCVWVRRQRDAFANEFRIDSRVKRQLGEKYRVERQNIDALLRQVHGAQAEQYPALRALRRRTEALAPIVNELRHLDRAGRLSESFAGLAASYAHMHVNRMLRSAHRFQELVLYELLDRTYRSQVARA